jgi:mono/diheme cytochrome c family protein
MERNETVGALRHDVREREGAAMKPACTLLLALVLAAEVSRAEEPSPLEWGKQLYGRHCAPCHGTDATGSGPLAKSLKTPPADLTQLSKRHGGTFPRDDVVRIIDGSHPSGTHDSEMPHWGQLFRQRPDGSISASGSVPEIYAITDYLASIQR